MSPDSGPVARYVEEQLTTLKKYPLMWGPPLCVELAFLQLLETLVVALRPDIDQREPMFVKDRYRRFLADRFPSLPPGYLSLELGESRITELVCLLSEFEASIRTEASPQNPFELYDAAKRNLMTVVVENQQAEPFDRQGVIRALDLDQASFRLRTDDGADHHCVFFTDPASALQSWEFDTRVRVHGERYSSGARRAVVFVEELEILAAA